MELKKETKNNILKIIENTLGISYEEFENLNFDEQQKLIAIYKRKHKKIFDEVITMMGSGASSMFTRVKKGERVMIGSDENSCFVREGISPEEAREELNTKIDNALYSKPVAFVKKLQRLNQK